MFGYIKLHRKILDSEIWLKPPEYLKIFMYILLKVNHKDGTFPRGSNFFNFSEEQIAGVTAHQIYHFLKWASGNAGILAKQKTTRGIVIKVNNYNTYQMSDDYNLRNSLRNNCEIAAKQLRNNCETINKNDKNDKNEKKKEKDLFFNPDFSKIFGMYSENCPNLTPLTFERRNRATIELLNSFLNEIDYDFSYFLDLCKKANSLKKIIDTRIDFRSMLRNHIGIMNGKYEQTNGNKRGVNQDALQEFLNGGKVSNG